MHTPIWLNEADVRASLSMRELIGAMEAALIAFSRSEVDQPVRSVIEVSQGHSFFASMPVYARAVPALGAKLVAVFHDNAAQGLPTHLATIVLLDPETGSLHAVLDGRYITEGRTAAVSAVAVRYLAGEDSPVLAIIGSGVQARSHLEALAHVRSFQQARCWSPTPAHVEALARETHAIPVQAAPSAQAAVNGADVVVLVTSSPDPVIQDAWVKPGALVIGVGACRPYQREIDPALVARSRLIVDSRASALRESGDVLLAIEERRITPDHIAAELGEVAAQPKLGRTSADQVIVFKSLGLAVEDMSAAHLALACARHNQRGASLA